MACIYEVCGVVACGLENTLGADRPVCVCVSAIAWFVKGLKELGRLCALPGSPARARASETCVARVRLRVCSNLVAERVGLLFRGLVTGLAL